MTIEHAERVQVKFFATDGIPEPDALIPVFHAWIRDERIDDDTLVDVADYTHVHQGPGVLLVGHGSDWYYDLGEGRPGLMFSRKRAFEGDFAAVLENALRNAIRACKFLSEDTSLRFGAKEVLVRVPDRLHVRNDAEGYAAAKPTLEKVAGQVFAGSTVTLAQEGQSYDSLTVRLRIEGGASDVSDLNAN